MSKYDSIETAKDLVREVAAHGLSTAQEDINRAQDIFGRSTIDELAALANDIGRNNANGEPDPKGSWSSSRKPTQETFYFIAFNIWHWSDAVSFFNEHTGTDKAEARRLAKENTELSKRFKCEYDRAETNATLIVQYDAAKRDLTSQCDSLNAKIQEKDAEIMALKAKLYDMMMAGA